MQAEMSAAATDQQGSVWLSLGQRGDQWMSVREDAKMERDGRYMLKELDGVPR